MAELGASIASDKRTKPDTNCLSDRRKGPSPKPEKGSRDAWRPGGREGVLVAALGNRKGGASRPGASRGC